MEWPRRSTPVLLPEDGMSSCTSNTRNRSEFRTANIILPPKGKERWEASGHSQGILPQNWGGTEQNPTVTCLVLKAMANDRRKILTLSRDEFRGP
ncbi:hypothetical protein TNCV_4606711 [Trichonephila clavipes]|nr:hypothetical protein TNCV_4606711 [Trichonephila clavipes]